MVEIPKRPLGSGMLLATTEISGALWSGLEVRLQVQSCRLGGTKTAGGFGLWMLNPTTDSNPGHDPGCPQLTDDALRAMKK